LYLYSLFCSLKEINSLPLSILIGTTDFKNAQNFWPYLWSVNLKSTPSWWFSTAEQYIWALCFNINCSKNNIVLFNSFGIVTCLTWTLHVYTWGVKLFLQSSHCCLFNVNLSSIDLDNITLFNTSFCIVIFILKSFVDWSVYIQLESTILTNLSEFTLLNNNCNNSLLSLWHLYHLLVVCNYLSHILQYYIWVSSGIPSDISIFLVRQVKQVLYGFAWIELPHRQHNIFAGVNFKLLL